MTGVKKDSLGNLYVTKDTLAFMEGQEKIEKSVDFFSTKIKFWECTILENHSCKMRNDYDWLLFEFILFFYNLDLTRRERFSGSNAAFRGMSEILFQSQNAYKTTSQ